MGGALWLPGVVAAHYQSSIVPGEPPVPYRVHLERGDDCYASRDHPEVIRSGGGNHEELIWNARTKAMEVAAAASLAVHPSSSRLAIGMWREGVASGVLYSIEIGPPVGSAPRPTATP